MFKPPTDKMEYMEAKYGDGRSNERADISVPVGSKGVTALSDIVKELKDCQVQNVRLMNINEQKTMMIKQGEERESALQEQLS